MVVIFRCVADNVRSQACQLLASEPPELCCLDRRARLILGLFTRRETVTTTEIARAQSGERMAG